MAWIQVHQTLKDHRKLFDAADELEVSPPHMMGLLVSFWLWALDNAPSGNLEGITPRMIARAAQWEGQAEKLTTALIRAGWLDEKDGGTLEIHDWYEYAGKLIDQRQAEKIRSQKRRAAAAPTPCKPDDDRQTTGGRPGVNRRKAAGRVDQSRVEKKEDIPPTPLSGGAPPAEEAPVPFAKIMELYNSICISFPKIKVIDGQRRKAVAARWRTYKSIEVFERLFRLTEASDFMKGANEKNWSADFDWIMKPTNMAKTLEGKYDNDRMKGGGRGGINSGYSGRQGAESQQATEAGAPKLSGFQIVGDDGTDGNG